MAQTLKAPAPPGVRWFTVRALIAAALLSFVAVIPFQPFTHEEASSFAFAAHVISTTTGNVQIYWDDGSGFSEAASATFPVNAGVAAECRIALPAGTYRAFRFDPIDRDGTLMVESPRVEGPRGRIVRRFEPADFKPLHEIASSELVGGRLRVSAVHGATDPQMLVTLDPPLKLALTQADQFLALLEPAGLGFLLLAGGLWFLDLPKVQGRLAAAGTVFHAHPGRAVAAAAAAAALLSSWPVVFLGRSYVAPDLDGLTLLYDAHPTIPGSTATQPAHWMGSDVGAILWQSVPYGSIQNRALLGHGEMPLWNRYDSCGSPLLGQGQSMLGDPLQAIIVAANGAAWAWDLKFLAAKALFAGGLGALVLALTGSLSASLLVAIAAPFAGFFIYRINHPAFFSFCDAPWPLLCWVRIAGAPRFREGFAWTAGLVAANLALMASGAVKEAYVLLLVMNFAGFSVVAAAGGPWRIRLAKIAGTVWAGVLFVLISSPLWLTFLRTLGESYTSYGSVSAFQIQPSLLLAAFDEALFRPLNVGRQVFDPSANFLILGGLLYFLATLRTHASRPAVIALAASSLVPLAFAFGLVPPAWIEQTPFLRNVAHIDNCFLCALITLWSVLAGVGFAAAARRLKAPEGRADLIVALVILFLVEFQYLSFLHTVHKALYGPGLTFSVFKPGESVPLGPFVGPYLAVITAALAALGWIARRIARAKGSVPELRICFALCLGILLWRAAVQPASAGFENYVVRLNSRADFDAVSPAMEFLKKAVAAEPTRAVGLQGNFFPGWSPFYNLEGISGPDALMNTYYRELTGAAPIERLWDWRLYLVRAKAAAARPFLDFLNVGYYLDRSSDESALGGVLKPVFGADLDIYESATVWPRAFFSAQMSAYRTPADLMARIVASNGHPFAAVQEGDPEAEAARATLGANGATLRARDYVLTPDSTAFTVDAPARGVAVLHEVYWHLYAHAEVDGHAEPVLRINHAFQGVLVGPGKHRIQFRYRPTGFGGTLAAAIVGLLLLGGTWLVSRRHGQRQGA